MKYDKYVKNEKTCTNLWFQNTLLSERKKMFRRKGKYGNFLCEKEENG